MKSFEHYTTHFIEETGVWYKHTYFQLEDGGFPAERYIDYQITLLKISVRVVYFRYCQHFKKHASPITPLICSSLPTSTPHHPIPHHPTALPSPTSHRFHRPIQLISKYDCL